MQNFKHADHLFKNSGNIEYSQCCWQRFCTGLLTKLCLERRVALSCSNMLSRTFIIRVQDFHNQSITRTGALVFYKGSIRLDFYHLCIFGIRSLLDTPHRTIEDDHQSPHRRTGAWTSRLWVWKTFGLLTGQLFQALPSFSLHYIKSFCNDIGG